MGARTCFDDGAIPHRHSTVQPHRQQIRPETWWKRPWLNVVQISFRSKRLTDSLRMCYQLCLGFLLLLLWMDLVVDCLKQEGKLQMCRHVVLWAQQCSLVWGLRQRTAFSVHHAFIVAANCFSVELCNRTFTMRKLHICLCQLRSTLLYDEEKTPAC